jgi:hypothetical protein
MSHHHGHHHHGHGALAGHKHTVGRKPTYTKIFRWEQPAGQPVPGAVEVVGSFTGWKKLPLERSAVTGTWQISIADIVGSRTHHYMLLVDGKPVSDKNCDGLAIPTNAEEAQYQLATPRGPRVLMLFAQTK